MDASLNYVYMQVEGVGLPNVNDTAEAYVGNFKDGGNPLNFVKVV